MKKCPNCQKTFEDNMKFCQTDGTPLVVVADNKPEVDPYATMVANKGDFELPLAEPKKAEPKPEEKPEPKVEVDPYATMVAGSQNISGKSDKSEEDILDIPIDDDDDLDPMKTVVVSGSTADNIRVNIREEKSEDRTKPVVEAGKVQSEKEVGSEDKTMMSPEIPKFNEPEIAPPKVADSAPKPPAKAAPPKAEARKPEPPKATPSSPFDAEKPKAASKPTPPKQKEEKPTPIPSPFDDSMPPGYAPPSTPPFEPPKEPIKPKPLNEKKKAPPKSPFSEPKEFATSERKAAGKPSSNPVSNLGNQAVANKNQFESPVASDSSTPTSSDGQNKTLAYVSLGVGIASYVCLLGPIGGLVAIITGYMARSKEQENPNEYGGGTIAIIGMILGSLTILLSVIGIALWIILIALAS